MRFTRGIILVIPVSTIYLPHTLFAQSYDNYKIWYNNSRSNAVQQIYKQEQQLKIRRNTLNQSRYGTGSTYQPRGSSGTGYTVPGYHIPCTQSGSGGCVGRTGNPQFIYNTKGYNGAPATYPRGYHIPGIRSSPLGGKIGRVGNPQ